MPQATSDSELVTLLREYLGRSENGPGSTLAENRDQATDYYLGRLTGRATTDGLSDQISGDQADMVDAICSEIAVNVLSTDQLLEFEPGGDEDRTAARVESAVVNRVIMEQNPGYELLLGATQSAALYKNGIVCVEADSIEKQRTRFVGDVAGDQKRIIEGETGGTIDKDGNLEWTETQNRVTLHAVAPENWFTDGEYPGWSLANTNFAAERKYYARGDLVDLGYSWDVVKDLNTSNNMLSTAGGDISRRFVGQGENIKAQATDEQDVVETFICYVRLASTDHKLRLHKVHIAGSTVLDKQPVDFVPYACGKLIPMVGRHHGVSIHDRVKPIEDGRTYALRQWEDNLAYGNNNELVLGATANEKDAQERLPGGYLRAEIPTDVNPLPAQDMGPASKLYLDEMRTLRSERGGSALDMQRSDSQVLGGQSQVGSLGVGMLLSAAELRTAWYTRNLAETLFRQVFMLTHETLRRYEVDPIGVYVQGQYVEVDTRQFKEREVVNLRSGMSSSERVRKIQALDHTIQTQMGLAQAAGNGVLSDLAGLHQAVVDRDKAAGIDNPQRYWIDPESPKSLQAQQANAQSQQQQQQLAQQLEQATQQLEQAKLQLDKYKHDGELKFDYDELAVKTEIEEAKIVGTATTQIELAAINKENEDEQRSVEAS
jgi:hypothetical protein